MPIFADGEFKQQFCVNLPVGVRIRVTFCQAPGDNVQIRTCLLQRYSRFQPSETGKCFVISARKKIVIRPEDCERNDNVTITREANAIGNNTNDFARHSINTQTLSKGERQCAEPISPEPFADQYNFSG